MRFVFSISHSKKKMKDSVKRHSAIVAEDKINNIFASKRVKVKVKEQKQKVQTQESDFSDNSSDWSYETIPEAENSKKNDQNVM